MGGEEPQSPSSPLMPVRQSSHHTIPTAWQTAPDTELHPGDAGVAVGGSGGPRGAEGWALSCISLYLEDSIPQTEKQTDRQTLYSLLVLLSRFRQGLCTSGLLWSHRR